MSLSGVIGRIVVAAWLVGICAAGPAGAEPDAPDTTSGALGTEGYIIIEGAREPGGGFIWEEDTRPGHRVLTWEGGRLVVPDSVEVGNFSRGDLGIPCGRNLAGAGGSGQLVFRDGIFTISEPVVLGDGTLELNLVAGELEIRGAVIRYRRPAGREGFTKPGMLMLAGMALLVVVLMRRARLQFGKKESS